MGQAPCTCCPTIELKSQTSRKARGFHGWLPRGRCPANVDSCCPSVDQDMAYFRPRESTVSKVDPRLLVQLDLLSFFFPWLRSNMTSFEQRLVQQAQWASHVASR